MERSRSLYQVPGLLQAFVLLLILKLLVVPAKTFTYCFDVGS